MGNDLDRRKIVIKEQPSSVVKEKTHSLARTEKSLQVQKQHEYKHPFGQPYIDPSCLFKQNVSDEHVIQYKSVENMADNNDELVQNMSNLPGFLQRVEKKRNIQEKALNFGVLDWKSLENWKFNERMPGKYMGKTSLPSSSSSSTPEGPPKISPNLRKQPSHELHTCSSPGKPSIPHGSMLSSLSQSKPSALNSLHLNEGKKYVAALTHDKINAHEQKNEPRVGELNLTSESFPSELQEIKLQEPEYCRCQQSSCLENYQCAESRTSFDEQICKEIGSRLSPCFSPLECLSGEHSAHVSHLFPQSSVVTVPTESATTTPSDGKFSTMKEKTTRHSFSVEGSEKTRADVSKDPTVKGRHPSPIHHRFSFNLARISRSFSFKEGFAAAQLNPMHTAAKSETAKPEISSNVDNFDIGTSNSRIKGRSSPLRRLLDPLLKHKGAQSKSVHPSNESVQSMISGDMASKGLSRDKKLGTSTSKALFHLTLKNGLPFFKFVVEKKIDKLAAVMYRHPQSGKSDNVKVFVFYSLNEIRKKGMNWMSQGSKATDSSGLSYNIVGQMKISSSCIDEDSGQCVERECVLYGVDPLDIIEQTHEFSPNKEIAAIVVKNSVEKLNDKELSRTKGFHDGNTQENEISRSTVVILPSGVHGTPSKGAPSPLISRWKSCGVCDCGGWDVGCKLRILNSHHENYCKIMQQSISMSSSDLVNFFMQEGQHENKPVLTLEQADNGFYSVSFDASISLLEAFATCVASVTCRKFYKILGVNKHLDTEFIAVGTASTFQEPRAAEYSACPPLSPVGRI